MKKVLPAVLLLWILTADLHNAAGQICNSGWQYHDPTGTCMTLTRQYYYKSYIYANWHCETFKGGSDRDIPGHLVYIFNKQTDDFVKGLLKNGNDFALIGLHDRGRNGNYVWGESNTHRMNYTGWKSASFYPDTDKNAVIITNDGWEEYGTENAFINIVCQVDAVFPRPSMTCPAAEDGAQNHIIECRLELPDNIILTEMSLYRAGQHIVTCRSQTCGSNDRYETSIFKERDLRTKGIWLMTLNIKKVDRSDEKTTWNCRAHFSNSHQTESRPCNLQIYTLPQIIKCNTEFIQSTVEVICRADRVYPGIVCSWEIYRDTYDKVQDYTATIPDTPGTDSFTYYNAACKVNFKPTKTGVYGVKVWIRPDLQTAPTKTEDITVTVALPEQPPRLYELSRDITNSTLVVNENQSVSINCFVTGGTPPVSSTEIYCSQQQYAMNSGQSVTIIIKITRGLHNLACTCRGNHVTGPTINSYVTFLVKFPATITNFTMDGQMKEVEVDTGRRVIMKCTAGGYPQPRLSLYKDGGNNLKEVSGNEVTHDMSAVCPDTGRYVCLVQNRLNTVLYNDSRYVDLRVRCPPEYCDKEPLIKQIGAAVNADAYFKICVLAYPSPTSFKLFKGSDTNKEVATTRYKASFQFTDETKGQGEITINITSITQQELGYYQLYSEYIKFFNRVYSYLRFQLIPRGPPACPTNFTVTEIHHDSVTVSWVPGFNGGLEQTFTVLRYEASDNMSYPLTDNGTLQEEEHSRDVMSHNITGLSESTTYIFGIGTKNIIGSPDCSHIQAYVFTSASPFRADGQSMTSTVVPAVIGLILIMLVVLLLLVLIRRRRSRTEKTVVLNTDSTMMSREDTNTSGRSDGDDSVYANTNGETTAGAKLSKQKQESTYIQFIKKNVTAKKLTKDKKKSMKNKEDCDNMYAKVNKNNKKTDILKRNNETVYNNVDAAMYSNTPNLNDLETSGAADQDNLYANANSSTPKKRADGKKNTDTGRTVNEDGLIYVAVEINKKTTNPEIVSANKIPKMPAGSKNMKEENVEYMAIDFTKPVNHF